MSAISTPVEGVTRLTDFLIDRPASTPDDIRATLRELVRPGQSPVVASVRAAELIYARRDELPVELLEMGAQLAVMAATFSFHDMAEAGRGYAIAATIRAMPGVSSEPPSPASTEPPELKPEFVSQETLEGGDTVDVEPEGG